MTPNPTPRTLIAQIQTQSVSSSPSEAVRIAAKNHTFWFKWYVGWIVIGALVSVFLTWMVWRSGNLLQDAAVADANKAAGDANKAAGDANERAGKLEASAIEAKSAQQKVEIDLAGAKAKQAEAERTLLEIQERFTPRTLIGEKRDTFVKQLADVPKGKVEVSVITGDPEAYTFAAQLWNALKDAGFDVGPQLVSFTLFGPPPVGVIIGVKDKDKQPPYGGEIQKALKSIEIDAGGELFGAEDGVVYIRVGIKPSQ